MTLRYAHVIQAVFNRPWAIQSGMLKIMADLVLLRAGGERLTDEEAGARITAQSMTHGERLGAQDLGSTRVIPIYGVIAPRMSLMLYMSGGTSLDMLRSAIDEAVADPDISSIVFDIDSPGGSVDGLAEFADYLRSVRSSSGKHLVAIADYQAASAAYYIAAQTHEVVATPSALVGSIGTVAIHQDESRALDAEGITTTLIASDPRKVEGNPYEPLTTDALSELQHMVDSFATMFVNDVAKGRGIAAAKIRSDFGGGREFMASEAKAIGMVDSVETLEAVVNRLNRTSRRPAGARAEDDSPAITASTSIVALTGDGEEDPEPQATADPAIPAPIPEHVLAAIKGSKRTLADRQALTASISRGAH